MRRLIGIAGAPGAGKSTISERHAVDVGSSAVVVPMDGFHLAQVELERRGLSNRKGAPETFDVDGFVSLLTRIRSAEGTVVAPAFRREIEEPIAGAIAVVPEHSVVLIEGNYLLHDADGWERVGPLLDECWFVETDDELRRSRLLARHMGHGRTESEAMAWMASVDEPNAELVARSRTRADRVVRNDNEAA